MSKPPRVLTVQELNRATLHRQLLLRRSTTDAAEAVEHLLGLQTQVPHNHYTALWTRLEGFDADDFSRRFEQREFVRLSLQRSTIHTVTARDCLGIRPLLQTVQDKSLKGAWGKRLVGVDLDETAELARELVEERPLTFKELGVLLAERREARDQAEHHPSTDPQALAMAARNMLALVQVPPRGLWQKGGLPTHTTAEHWLGAGMAPIALDDLVLRYLGSFGPASVMDTQMWCGLTRLRESFDRLRDTLVVFRDENGVELFDLPDAPRPAADVHAPVRFLPEFDNVFIGHKDRSRIIDDRAAYENTWKGNVARPVFTVDGFINGSWQIDVDKKRSEAVLTVKSFGKLSPAHRDELADEGTRLLEFHAPGAGHDIRWETYESEAR
jgi:hypothetical protein